MAEIIIPRSDIRSLLDKGGMCAVPDKVLPMSGYVRITTKGTRIRMESSCIFSSIKAYADASEVTEDMSFCVSARELSSCLSVISDSVISIITDSKEHMMSLVHSGGRMRMPFLDAQEFHNFEPVPKTAYSVTLSSGLMVSWIKACRLFAANDELRPVLNGMRFAFDGSKLSACASNGHILFYDEAEYNDSQDVFQIIIPSHSMQAVSDVIKGSDTFTMSTDGKRMWVAAGGMTLSVLLTEGKYPNIKSVIPESFAMSATVNKSAIAESMKRISLMHSAQSDMARFSFGEHLDITSEDTDFSRRADERIQSACEGNITIGLSCRSLTKALSVIEGETVTFRMNAPDKAVVIDNGMDGNHLTTVLMPMMLN